MAETKQTMARTPVLRIETGMHTASIKRIGVDAANHYLVTASDDKTARVWELATRKLLRVLRPPLGAGNEGKLNAVALSPDGRTVAVGGWTGHEWDQTMSIYLFDRESGRLVQHITGLPSVITHLVYAPDGRWLAAMLGGQNGVRVYETSGYKLVGKDRDYGNASYGADFDAAGRLVTTCDDGYLRLYERASGGALRLKAKRKAAGGAQPSSVSFAPDNLSIAVGFDDSTKVAVLSGQDLSLRYAPDTSSVDNGSLSSVAWSADGQTLSAGGRYDKGGQCLIRQWADGGRGAYLEVAAASQTIFHILPLRNGGIIYGTGDPAFGVIGAAGQRALFTGPAIADYGALLNGFLLSASGDVVQFGYEVFGKSPARFAIPDRRLELVSNNAATLQPPLVTGLNVTDWEDSGTPKLNGQALVLDQYERSFSLAIAPDKTRFLLGTDWSLRLYDRSGKQLWRVAIPDVAWSVNISGDGKLAVAAFADGTIRWYRLTDGQELLAFFPHHDRERWVLWTPQGYYDAAPGAEALIGWHVNNGPEQAADFFPVGQFREVYYRPDVISRVLTTLDEGEALRVAESERGRVKASAPKPPKDTAAEVLKRLPPVIELLAPMDGMEVWAAELMAYYKVRAPSGEPVTRVKALVDGRPVEVETGVAIAADTPQQLRVTIPEHDCELAVLAENRFAASVPATARLKWRGRVTTASVIKPNLYLLAVGVSQYANADYNLGFAAKDARDFAGAMQRQQGLLYGRVEARVLEDARATRDEVADGLDWITQETTSKDVAMVFLAGHGVNDQLGRYFFWPHNVAADRLLRTGVSFSDIKSAVEAIAGKAVFFVDTCHAGNALGGQARAFDLNGFINELTSAENGAVVFAASTGRQHSLEHADWGNGAFTKALVEGVGGSADYEEKGKITITSLDLYLSARVKKLTGGKQTPTTTKPKTVPDFPIAVKQ